MGDTYQQPRSALNTDKMTTNLRSRNLQQPVSMGKTYDNIQKQKFSPFTSNLRALNRNNLKKSFRD
tara:strand:- start:179 stop:376 length:198 start_codon:yes stop_codon:yes gene_type:complete